MRRTYRTLPAADPVLARIAPDVPEGWRVVLAGTAYHEAGHAVHGVLHGYRLVRIDVMRDRAGHRTASLAGRVEFDPSTMRGDGQAPPYREWAGNALAGLAAETEFLGTDYPSDAAPLAPPDDDRRGALRFVLAELGLRYEDVVPRGRGSRRHLPAQRRALGSLAAVREETRGLLRRHAAAVRALALALTETDALDGATATAIVANSLHVSA